MKYVEPMMEMIGVEAEDVIRTSGVSGSGDHNFGDGDGNNVEDW